MIDDSWVKIIFLIFCILVALGIGINSQLSKRKLKKKVTIVLTLQEHEVLKNICMEILGNRKWKVGRERALTVNKILDKLEGPKK